MIMGTMHSVVHYNRPRHVCLFMRWGSFKKDKRHGEKVKKKGPKYSPSNQKTHSLPYSALYQI